MCNAQTFLRMKTPPLPMGDVLFTHGNAAARTFGRAHRRRPYHFSYGSVSQGCRKRLCRRTKSRNGCRKRLRRWTKSRKGCRKRLRRWTKTRKGCRKRLRRPTKREMIAGRASADGLKQEKVAGRGSADGLKTKKSKKWEIFALRFWFDAQKSVLLRYLL